MENTIVYVDYNMHNIIFLKTKSFSHLFIFLFCQIKCKKKSSTFFNKKKK